MIIYAESFFQLLKREGIQQLINSTREAANTGSSSFHVDLA